MKSPLIKKKPTPFRMGTVCVTLENDEGQPKDPYNASSTPIYQTATFKQTSAIPDGKYDYSRSGNPTRSGTEAHLSRGMCCFETDVFDAV